VRCALAGHLTTAPARQLRSGPRLGRHSSGGSLRLHLPTHCLPACFAAAAAIERAKERRELLGWPESTDPAADHWQSGTAWQTTMEQLPFKHIEPPASDSEAARAGGSVTQ
jgi:hypothetical protein